MEKNEFQNRVFFARVEVPFNLTVKQQQNTFVCTLFSKHSARALPVLFNTLKKIPTQIKLPKKNTCQISVPKKVPESKISNPKKSFYNPRHLKSRVPPLGNRQWDRGTTTFEPSFRGCCVAWPILVKFKFIAHYSSRYNIRWLTKSVGYQIMKSEYVDMCTVTKVDEAFVMVTVPFE